MWSFDAPDSPADGGARRSRRSVLRSAAIGATLALSGCTEEIGSEFPPEAHQPISELLPDLPVEERTNVWEERITTAVALEIDGLDAFAGAFDEFNIDVEAVDRVNDVVVIGYINTDRYAEGNVHDVATLAGGYAALLDAGYDAEALGITILDDAPASYGTATVETRWAEAFNAGELTAAEYGELVETTIESRRRSPDVEVDPEE